MLDQVYEVLKSAIILFAVKFIIGTVYGITYSMVCRFKHMPIDLHALDWIGCGMLIQNQYA